MVGQIFKKSSVYISAKFLCNPHFLKPTFLQIFSVDLFRYKNLLCGMNSMQSSIKGEFIVISKTNIKSNSSGLIAMQFKNNKS
jgi:hypothetical protein